MVVEKWMMDFLEDLRIDEDIKQDVYVKLLEMPEKEINKGYLQKMAGSAVINKIKQDALHRDLRLENLHLIRKLFSEADKYKADPVSILMVDEMLDERLRGLSHAQRKVINGVYMEGRTPEEVARREGIRVGAVYKRIHDAKRIVEGKNDREE